MDKPYHRLLIACTLSITTLAECAIRMKPSHTYELHVSPREMALGKNILRSMAALVTENPFAPYVNLVTDSTLEPYEWYMRNESGEAWGSEGP